MGEIATWSAVKTKVGLGKDSNECPTKAELLALSPTGTGENYVGLEISNASSYGNNETVQLSDIHKVTYKYTFTVDRTTLSFPTSGGAPSPNLWFGLVSRKQKYVDGISGSYTTVGYTMTAYPDWVSYNQTVPQYEAKENTGLVERSANMTFTQNESGKQITVQFTQAAATSTWAYTFTLTKASSNSIGALGGKVTFEIDSYKQEIRNGHNYGSQIPVSYKRTDDPDSSEILEMTIPENKTESSRGFNYIWTQDESNKKQNYTVTQAAGVKTYGTPTVYLGNIADIPASGGTAATPTYTYSQLWGWNGKTNDGDTISSGASVVWSENISGSNLGTTVKARTKLGSRTLTVTLNGKSGSASIDIYQAENKITNTTQGAWEVSISANPSTFTEQGGTSQISASARAPRTNHWSSGATNAASDAIGTPTLSIPTASTGFSLSGTTLTVAENTTANQRSVVVRATMDTVYKEVTVTQSVYLVEWRYTLTTSTPTLSFDALSTTKSGTISSYREKYINGSLVEGSLEDINIRVKSTSAEIQSATAAVAITMKENTTTQARTGTVVYEQVGSGKTITITCNQAAGTISTRYEISWTANYNNGIVEENVTKVVLEGTTGMENSVRMDLHILEYTSINGVEGTPTSWGSRTIAENNSAIASPSGQVSATLQSDSENAFIGITNSVQNLVEYPRTHTITLYNPKVVINGKEVGTVPTITLMVNPIPYTRVFEFGWKQEEGSTITNITLNSDIYGSSTGSRDIISYASLRRDGVEFAKKYLKPTLIPSSEDWLQVIDNGQNSDNSYNWVFKALTNNEGDSARNQQVRFEQPGNGNQALYAYVSQDPVVTELNCELGNYYSYGASDIVNIGFGWNSKDGGDTTSSGGMNTPGGYLEARIFLPAENDYIDMYAVGLPTYNKPLKIKLSNIRKVKKISQDNNQYTGLSVGYSQQDYKLGIVMNVGMENYFQLTPSILSESGEYGGGIQIQVTLKQTYDGYSGDYIANITLTPKDSNLPTLYLNIAWGNP